MVSRLDPQVTLRTVALIAMIFAPIVHIAFFPSSPIQDSFVLTHIAIPLDHRPLVHRGDHWRSRYTRRWSSRRSSRGRNSGVESCC